MRFATIILSLFILTNISKAHGKEYYLIADSTKSTKKHTRKYYNQPRAKYSAPPDKEHFNDCVFTNKYTIAQRLKRYPFSKATKILTMSYDGTGEPNTEITANGDTLDAITHKKYSEHRPHALHFDNSTLNHASIFEMKRLTPKQINRLTNILYNTDYRIPNNYAHPGYSCFNPRNALIFYDKNGKVFDYLEICFECDRIESKSNRIYFNSSCTQGLDLVKKFLIDVGIKYGTLKTKNPDDQSK
jgi:hypothetical protein